MSSNTQSRFNKWLFEILSHVCLGSVTMENHQSTYSAYLE